MDDEEFQKKVLSKLNEINRRIKIIEKRIDKIQHSIDELRHLINTINENIEMEEEEEEEGYVLGGDNVLQTESNDSQRMPYYKDIKGYI